MDYSLLFAIERNQNYQDIRGPNTKSTNSIDEGVEEDCTLLTIDNL